MHNSRCDVARNLIDINFETFLTLETLKFVPADGSTARWNNLLLNAGCGYVINLNGSSAFRIPKLQFLAPKAAPSPFYSTSQPSFIQNI